MTSISELNERPSAFKLDLICQKLQQDTCTESSDVSLPVNPEVGDNGGFASGSDQEDFQQPENLQHRHQQTDQQEEDAAETEDAPPSEDDEEDGEGEDAEDRRHGESDSDTVDCDRTTDVSNDVSSSSTWPWMSTPMSEADHLPLSFQQNSDSARRNKRKNFQPRAIVYQYSSDRRDASTNDEAHDGESALDLTDTQSSPATDASAPMDLTVRTPTQINRSLPAGGANPTAADASEISRYAETTMRELLGMYGLHAEHGDHRPPAPGKLFERLTSRLPVGGLGGGGGPSPPSTPPHQPPTPPRTPRQPSPGVVGPVPPPAAALEQQRRLLAAAVGTNGLLLPQNMATLLRFAAFNQERSPILPGAAHNAHVVAGTPVPPSGGSPSTNGLPGLAAGTADRRSAAVDYGRYVRRYGSAQECGFNYCSDLSYREHFHCLECNSRVFVKKEEMIRHFKWHKKRDDSLQHGFMRYSPTDDCGDRYADCTHNRRQTHYHCLKDGCDKVYISTSDVQMHANYHRKDSAIQQEGFQRYRASEDCAEPLCAYQGQRTTHFHCKRPGCSYTFKNKADMEKHKTYHIKDEQLNKDGFKKFIKHEHCPFENCRFSKVCNHIHCIRPGCSYVLHSSGQLYSHKRKHERQDSEAAYRNYRLMQGLPASRDAIAEQFPSLSVGSPLAAALGSRAVAPSIRQLTPTAQQPSPSTSPGSTQTQSPLPTSPSDALRASPYGRLGSLFPGILNPANFSMEPLAPQDMKPPLNAADPSDAPQLPEEELMLKFVLQLADGSTCEVTGCEFSGAAHYHCSQPECGVLFQSREGAREHARNHELQQCITGTHYDEVQANEDPCPIQTHCLYRAKERHFHCGWEGCHEVILLTDKPFRRLDHYKMHDYSRRLALSKETPASLLYSSRAEAVLRRARLTQPGAFQVPGAEGATATPPALFGSFKLPRPWSVGRTADGVPADGGAGGGDAGADNLASAPAAAESNVNGGVESEQLAGFQQYAEGAACPDSACPLAGRRHQHCARPRCFFASADPEDLRSHATDFHDNVNILEGFAFYNRDVDCRMPGCLSNKTNRHFHCTRPTCRHSFVRYLAMAEHDQLHRSSQSPPTSPSQRQQQQQQQQLLADVSKQQQQLLMQSAAGAGLQNGSPVVKAAGTYYPLSAFATPGMPQGLVLHSRTALPGAANLPGEIPSGDATANRSPPPSDSQQNQPAEEKPHPPAGTDLVSRLLQSPAMLSRPAPASAAEAFSHFSDDQACGRPFCKLKRRAHFHCELCNQAFGELDKLQQHLERHAEGQQSPGPQQQQSEDGAREREREEETARLRDEERTREALRNIPGAEVIPEVPRHPILPFHPFAHPPFLGPDGFLMRPGLHPALAGFPMLTAPPGGLPISMAGSLLEPGLLARKRLSDGGDTLRPPEPTKKPRNVRVVKDEPVPEGYIRFRFNEDCKYPHCGYREHQTHFHCMRKDCGYSFCDKTRFVQHTARHERLDTLMGGDFVQYRANINCGREACIYANTLDQRQNKASHFHCLKCEFVCTDTNKVVAHRRQHTKLDSITQAGFEKFTPSQTCKIESCTHNNKQTHYHCVTCQYAVLGLSQMSAHKYRHME